jgi:hypothetical protein
MPILSIVRWLSIPLLVLAATAGPVYWAFPEGLSAARSLGIVLGWAGCGLLLASLLLMLRETWLSRWLGGLERMYQWHHRTGMAAYVLLLAHPLVLAADAWRDSSVLAWQTLSPFSQGWAVGLGWLSLLLLMLGLAATFATRLSYRVWRWLHVSLGIGVLLGLWHLLQLGIEEPVLPILGLASLFLGWRLIGEDFGLAARPYLVQAAAPVADGMVEISLKPLAEPIAAAAGQFVLVAFFAGPTFRGCGEFHPFTVSSIGCRPVHSGLASRHWAIAPDASRPSSPVSWRGCMALSAPSWPIGQRQRNCGWPAVSASRRSWRCCGRVRSASRPPWSISIAPRVTLLSCRNYASWPNAIHSCRCRLWPPATNRRISGSFLPAPGQLGGSRVLSVRAAGNGCRRSGRLCARAASQPRHIHFENFGFR